MANLILLIIAAWLFAKALKKAKKIGYEEGRKGGIKAGADKVLDAAEEIHPGIIQMIWEKFKAQSNPDENN